MKNYYKILGIKQSASEEEIRERWVELMRRLHPDQRVTETPEDERIKEINEAYQVLKHSSTRAEYDLKRAYDQRQRNSYPRRLSIPIAILVVFVIIGTIYLKRSHVTFQANLPIQDRIKQIDQINEIDQTNQKDQTDQRNQKDQIDQKDSSTPPRDDASSHPRIHASTHPVKRSNVLNDPNDRNVLNDSLMTKLPDDSITQLPNAPIAPTPQENIPGVLSDTNDLNDPTVSRMAASTLERISASSDPRVESSMPPRIDASTDSRIDASTHQPKRSNVLNDPNDRNVLNVALIATEEEVKRFFANYTERYTQKDLDSFISLFSSKAIQNRQNGLEEIRKIYGNFLRQSQEIKYEIDHIKIEIYQNGVEVKARYELVQMMKKSGDKRIWRGDIRWSLIKEDGALKILSLDYQLQKSP